MAFWPSMIMRVPNLLYASEAACMSFSTLLYIFSSCGNFDALGEWKVALTVTHLCVKFGFMLARWIDFFCLLYWWVSPSSYFCKFLSIVLSFSSGMSGSVAVVKSENSLSRWLHLSGMVMVAVGLYLYVCSGTA